MAGKIGSSPNSIDRAKERSAKGDDISWSKAGHVNYLNAVERFNLAQFILSKRVAQKGLTFQEVLSKAQELKRSRKCRAKNVVEGQT